MLHEHACVPSVRAEAGTALCCTSKCAQVAEAEAEAEVVAERPHATRAWVCAHEDRPGLRWRPSGPYHAGMHTCSTPSQAGRPRLRWRLSAPALHGHACVLEGRG